MAPPVRSDNYSFSVSSGNSTWYTPGMQMDLSLKTLDKDYKYIGTLLYAGRRQPNRTSSLLRAPV